MLMVVGDGNDHRNDNDEDEGGSGDSKMIMTVMMMRLYEWKSMPLLIVTSLLLCESICATVHFNHFISMQIFYQRNSKYH